MKKRLSIAILALFILGVCTGLACAQNNGKADPKDKETKVSVKTAVYQELRDMEGEWSREAVLKAQLLGFVNGDENHRFNPNQPLTHLEAITMLLNAEDIDFDTWEPEDETVTFFEENQDLLKKIPEWAQPNVMAAYEEGILLEDEFKRFNLNQGIKRYEVCRYIERMDAVEDYDTSIFENQFKFADSGEMTDENNEIVEELRDKGIINGYPDGYFYPNRVVKRCEMAVILGNLDDNVLHRLASSKIVGTLTEVSEPDEDGVYVLTVVKGGKTFAVDADEDTKVFSNGVEVDIDDIVDSQVRIIIKDDMAAMVSVVPEDTEEEEADSYEVEGILTDADAADEAGAYILTIDTEDDGDVEITVDADTEIQFDGDEITIDDLEDWDEYMDLQVEAEVYSADDEAAEINIIPEDD